jgi:cellulose synthase operon protein C
MDENLVWWTGSRQVRRVLRIARDERHQEMGNKTVKRLAILIGVIALVGGGGYFLWAFQVERKAHGVTAKADRAEKDGNYGEAEQLYREYLAVRPDDIAVQLKYAEALLKNEKASKRQAEALAIFESIVGRYPGRDDVRRRAAELAAEIGAAEKARAHLAILLKSSEGDGHLEYLMARCYEQDGEFERAAESYRSAIEHKAPERIEAAQQLAMLLTRDKDKVGKKERDEADGVIDAMVKSEPDDYRAYLARGRYRQASGGKGSRDDFEKALQLAPDRPEVYLEVASAVDRESGSDAARQVLDRGLAAAPKSVAIYVALANLQQKAGNADGAVEALELGLKVMPEELSLRLHLAMLLAGRGEGESGKLLMQIAELERLGANRPFTQYLTAHYHFNKHEFLKAEQILTPLQPDVVRSPAMKAMVNQLLARCYAETGQTEQQQDAIQRAYSTNPNDLTARLGYIQALISRGDLDGAIREYQELYKQGQAAGVARLPLASLLMHRILQLPPARRDWREVERLIAEALAAPPKGIEPQLLRARLLAEQGREAEADDALRTIRSAFPKDPRPWTVQAELLIRQKKFPEAQAQLDQAQRQLGDRVELRLARVLLASVRGGSQAVPALNELGRGLESFSREDRRRLLTVLAAELGRQRDLKGAAAAWEQLAREEAQSMQPRLQLFELAMQSGDAERAEEQIREVEKLDQQYGYLCRSQYLVWRARAATDPAAKEKARGEARGLLSELRVRRPDWSKVPLALAGLDEEELADAGADEARRREKLESAITLYRRAIELGLRDPGVARHYVQLLFRAGRGSEALEFYTQMPEMGQFTGDLGRAATELALANRDYRQAEDIARKAVEAKPEDFQARVELARVLMEQRRYPEAEDELRKAIDAAKTDPDRRITLVRFMVLTRQPAKAEEAVRDAEAHIAAAPLAMAQCCGIAGKAFELSEPDRAKSWYGQARGWFAKAQQALKDPGDLTVKRQLAELLLQTNEAATAEGPLREILDRTADGKSPALATWARRGLAQVYVNAKPPRLAEALALFAGKTGHGDDADDLRVLSLLHEAQGTPEGRHQAIGDLDALIAREAATPEDRRRLAVLLEGVGDWPRAVEQFRDLILRADAARDAETVARRPHYLALFVDGLIRHHKPGDDSDLAEARRLVEKLRPIQRDPLSPLVLEVQIDKAANQLDAATKRIRDFAIRTDVDTMTRLKLAGAAEAIGLLDAAEWVYRRAADEPAPERSSLPNKARLAIFLARHGKLKDAIDLCEGLWAAPASRESVSIACVQMLCNPASPVDEAQVRRVIGWIERASAESPRSMPYLVGLGSLYERLGEYARAEAAYRRAIKVNDRDGIASNNLAWLIALNGGGREGEALELINSAIRARGGTQPEYLDTRGMIYLAAGEPQRAMSDFEAAFRFAPTPSKYFHLAQAYLQLNDKERARQMLVAGKTRGLPGGLHRLELARYNKVASELGMK